MSADSTQNDEERKRLKRLRIMFVTNGSRPLGEQDQFLGYARRFAAVHHLSILFIFPVDGDDPNIMEFQRLGVEVRSLGSRSRLSALTIYKTFRHFQAFQPDIIHSQHPVAGVNAKLAGSLFRRVNPAVKVICEQRNMPGGLSPFARWLEYLTFGLADVVLCSSSRVEISYFGSSKELNVDTFSPKARKHYTFYNSVDPDVSGFRRADRVIAREVFRSEWSFDVDDFVFVSVAKLTKQKDYPALISGFAKARELVAGLALKLLCVGEGPERAGLERLIQDLALEEHVVLAGYRADVPGILSAADGFVLTSLWEGLPKALLEAMTVPLPCIATEVSGTEEVIRHGVDGVLIAPGDKHGCAEAMVLLASDSSFRRTLRENAAERVKLFTVSNQARTLLGIYERLCANSTEAVSQT